MSGKKPNKWNGELAEPLKDSAASPPSLGILSLEEHGCFSDEKRYEQARREWLARAATQDAEQALPKMYLLLDYYGIGRDEPTESKWFSLALHLAIDHVPGFRHAGDLGKPGRPAEWDSFKRTLLYCLVEKKKGDRAAAGLTCSDLDACNFILAETEWQPTFDGQAATTLRNVYLQSRSDGLVQHFILPMVKLKGIESLNGQIASLRGIVAHGPTTLNVLKK